MLTLAFGALAARLVILQIVDAPAYAQLAEQQRQREVTFAARRGAVFDREGEPLAISVDLQTIYTDPALVQDPPAAAEKLAPVLKMEKIRPLKFSGAISCNIPQTMGVNEASPAPIMATRTMERKG